jgi:hypothetical protein
LCSAAADSREVPVPFFNARLALRLLGFVESPHFNRRRLAMATANPVGPLGRAVRLNEEHYPYWRDHIPPDMRRQHVEEDLLASETVVAEMLGILVVAVVLAAGTVMLACH